MKENYYDILVIGGGAAGLAAAVSCIRHSHRRLSAAVLEKEEKPGRKLLATGSGRCNLTNLSMSERCYNYSARPLVKSVLEKYTPDRLLSEFEKLGLLCKADSEGRVYPYSNQASSVLGVMVSYITQNGGEIFSSVKTENVEKRGELWRVKTADREFTAKAVILSCGGAVSKSLGSDGSSYELARRLGLKCAPVFPSLCPINVSDKELKAAKGVRTAAEVCIAADGRVLKTERGELQINERTISGICVFQLSRIANEFMALGTVNGRKCREITISADLAPDYQADEIYAYFRQRRSQSPASAADVLFTGFLNKKLGLYLLRRCRIDTKDTRINDIPDKSLRTLADTVKHCTFKPSSPSSPDSAQVTAGGIQIGEVDFSFHCRAHKGLYVIGEALDADGICGGYNLHFAFSSGLIAGENAARAVLNGVKKHDKN